jgi:hypothetical protein
VLTLALAMLALAGERRRAYVRRDHGRAPRHRRRGGRRTARRVEDALSLPTRRILTFEVEQRVKGDVGGRIDVRSPSGTDCDLDVHEAQTIGLLLTRMPSGEWLGTASVVDPGSSWPRAASRGGPIKVGIGIVILGLVLLFASYRLRRGLRPRLPGQPEP